jgi:hypothetical protein
MNRFKLLIIAGTFLTVCTGLFVGAIVGSDTTYNVRVYTHDGDGSGKAMASLGDGAANMYDYKKKTDGTTQFCLEDSIVGLCFTTEDRFNAGSTEDQRLNFKLEQ